MVVCIKRGERDKKTHSAAVAIGDVEDLDVVRRDTLGVGLVLAVLGQDYGSAVISYFLRKEY